MVWKIKLSLSLSPPPQQGQVDCWPLPCPPVDCEFTVVPEGECCARCVTDPCQADTIRNDITKTCTDEHSISRFSGSSWIKHGTECTLCQCKVTLPRVPSVAYWLCVCDGGSCSTQETSTNLCTKAFCKWQSDPVCQIKMNEVIRNQTEQINEMSNSKSFSKSKTHTFPLWVIQCQSVIA